MDFNPIQTEKITRMIEILSYYFVIISYLFRLNFVHISLTKFRREYQTNLIYKKQVESPIIFSRPPPLLWSLQKLMNKISINRFLINFNRR